jgi:DNA-binding NarL/FixJ family response regulator
VSPAERARSGQSATAVAEVTCGSIRILIVHGQELMLLGARALFGRQEWVQRCLVATDLQTAESLTNRYEPHIALVELGSNDGAAALTAGIRRAHPRTRVVFMAEHGRLTHVDARTAGAAGLVDCTLPATELLSFTRALAAGEEPPHVEEHPEIRLSARERQVLGFLATGATNREIGRRLLLAPDTVKNHVSRTYRKLGARNRIEAVNRGRDLGLLS